MAGSVAAPAGMICFSNLGGFLRTKVLAVKAIWSTEREVRPRSNGPMNTGLTIKRAAELGTKVAHQMNVGTGKAKNRLPIVTHGKNADVRMLCL